MSAAVLACLFAAALAAPAGGGAAAGGRPALTVSLSADCAPAGRFVRLVDAAELSGELADRAGRVLLGPAPEAGARTVLGRDDVALRLEEEGFDRRRFEVGGAQEVVIGPAAGGGADGGAVPPADVPAGDAAARVSGWVRDALAARLGCPAALLSVRASLPAAAGRTALPADARDVEVLWPAGRPRLGRVRVTLLLGPGPGGARERLEVAVEAAARARVMVAARDIARGQALSDADARCEEAELTDLAERYVVDAAALAGTLAARPIRAGEPVAADMLRKVPAVRRGEVVTLVSESGAVRVTERAVARSDGGLGETIVVERFDKRPPLTVRVAGGGIVRVD